MGPVLEAMKKVIEKCDICIGGDVISKEKLLMAFYDFVLGTMEKKEHNVGIVMHTGSVCFDAILLTCAAISNILYNKTNAEDIINSLEPGKVVLLYNPRNTGVRRCRFRGIEENNSIKGYPGESEKYVVLELDENGNEGKKRKKSTNNVTKLPKGQWSRIMPYNGDASHLGAQGAANGSMLRSEFFKHVFGMQDSDIPRVIDTSTVIVIPKEKAVALVNGISFKFDGMTLRLTDLVPVSYFAYGENGDPKEIQYVGNSAKLQPVIKIAGRVSVARKLANQSNGNRSMGLIVSGDEAYRRGELEMPRLLENDRLQYVYVSVHMDSVAITKLLESYDDSDNDVDLFVCTRDFLNHYARNAMQPANFHTLQLENQVKAIMKREVVTIDVPGFIGWKEYIEFKESMLLVKRNEYDTDSKGEFIKQAYSLMNLFMTATFQVQRLDEYIDQARIDVKKVDMRMDRITEIINAFPNDAGENAKKAIAALETAYLGCLDQCNKEEKLIQIIGENFGKKMAIVIPKAYYSPIISDIIEKHFPNQAADVTIVTATKFDNSKLYDLVIAVGDISGTRFDALRCRSARMVYVLLYDVEARRFRKKLRDARREEHKLNIRSTFDVKDDYKEDQCLDEAEISEIEGIDGELSEFIDSILIRSIPDDTPPNESRSKADIVAFARFADEEIAVFTKNYKAYVLDEEENRVIEVEAEKLEDGDRIIFTRSNSKTRDIVENILQRMVESKALPAEDELKYHKSREWRTTLVDFMNRERQTVKDIAQKMANLGHGGVQEVTIKGWIEEESHTVIPKHLETIRQIAAITGDTNLFDNAETCVEAGKRVYEIRRDILAAISQEILGVATGADKPKGRIMEAVSEEIRKAAVILQIESVRHVNDKVSMHMINRPIRVD